MHDMKCLGKLITVLTQEPVIGNSSLKHTVSTQLSGPQETWRTECHGQLARNLLLDAWTPEQLHRSMFHFDRLLLAAGTRSAGHGPMDVGISEFDDTPFIKECSHLRSRQSA